MLHTLTSWQNESVFGQVPIATGCAMFCEIYWSVAMQWPKVISVATGGQGPEL